MNTLVSPTICSLFFLIASTDPSSVEDPRAPYAAVDALDVEVDAVRDGTAKVEEAILDPNNEVEDASLSPTELDTSESSSFTVSWSFLESFPVDDSTVLSVEFDFTTGRI